MRILRLSVAAAVLLASVTILGAQDKGKGKGGGKGFQLPPMIHITIADFPDGGHIPTKYTCAAGQASPSPAISWTAAAGQKARALPAR